MAIEEHRVAEEWPAPRATAARGTRAAMALALPFLFWTAFAIFVGVHTYLSMLSHHHSLPRLLAYELLAGMFWALATLPIAWLARRLPFVPWRWRSGAAHAGAATGFSTAYIAWLTALAVGLRPFDDRGIQAFGSGFVHTFASSFPLGVLLYAGTVGAVLAFDFHRRSRERAIRAAELERELTQARLDALAAQLQPHFLFNALHTVSGLIRAQESQAAITTLAGLSDLLRYALDGRGGPEATLQDELDAVRGYLEIQRLRYGERLVVTIDTDPEALRAMVPRLLLQPLVENAIHHGATPVAGTPWLRLRAARADDRLRIDLENSAGPRHDHDAGFGIGLRNTAARLDQLYGATARHVVHRHADRFELSLELPWREADAAGVAGA